MKMRKILATLAAAAVACSAMAVSAFAEITNANGEGPDAGRVILDVFAEGYDINEIYGIEVTFTGEIEGLYGAIIGQDATNSWNTLLEFGDDKETTIGDGVLTVLSDAPVFDTTSEWAKFVVADWGAPNVVEASVVLLDVDGNPIDLTADEPTDEPTDEPADEPAEDEPVEDEPTEEEPSDDNVQTGAQAGLALAAIALAGAAVVATKKQK